MARESGYYWTMINGVWICAEWSAEFEGWYIPGREEQFEDKDFSYIERTKLQEPK